MKEIIDLICRSNATSMNCVDIDDVDELRDYLQGRGYTVFVSDLHQEVREIDSFLAIVRSLPFCDAYHQFHADINLMSFADFLIDMIHETPKIAIVIKNAENLVKYNVNLLFCIYFLFISGVNRQRARGDDALIITLLVGKGDNFLEKFRDEKPTFVPEGPTVLTPEEGEAVSRAIHKRMEDARSLRENRNINPD